MSRADAPQSGNSCAPSFVPLTSRNATATATYLAGASGAFLDAPREAQGVAAGGLLHATAAIWDPTYFLCTHAIELALKAFLLSRNVPIAGTELETHLLCKLYGRCVDEGLSVAPRSALYFTHLARSLDAGNKGHNWRYYNATGGGGGMEPAWVCEEAADLIAITRAQVEPRYVNEPASPATKLCIIASKPKPK